MPTVLVPRAGGVLSALGLAMSDERRDYVRPRCGGGDAEEAFAAMEEQAREDLDDPELRRRADLRYRGQSFELTVEADDLDALEERFAEAHERRYGYRMEGEHVEVVNARLVATVPVERPELAAEDAEGEAERGRRAGELRRRVAGGAGARRAGLGAGSKVAGPAIVEFAEATCVVRAGLGRRRRRRRHAGAGAAQ